MDLFQQHCQTVIEENRLQSMLTQGKAAEILNQGSHLKILTNTETMETVLGALMIDYFIENFV